MIEVNVTVTDHNGNMISLAHGDIPNLQYLLDKLVKPVTTTGQVNITNHDWQEKALENMRKDAEAYNAANVVVKAADCSTDCYPCQSKKDTEAKIAEESPETLRGKDCIVHWDKQCNATCYPDVHS